MSTAADKRWFAAVASLERCVLCGTFGIQVAHRNQGRGMGQKSDAHMTAALCPWCHNEIDNGGKLLQGKLDALGNRRKRQPLLLQVSDVGRPCEHGSNYGIP